MESPIRTSENPSGCVVSLAKAQGAFGKIEKTRTAKVKGKTKDGRDYDFGYKYADLSDIWSAIRKPLSEAGLAITQAVDISGGRVTTRLWHETGWIEADYPYIASTPGDAQKAAAAATYAKRQGLQALLGIAAEDEDDGEIASEARAWTPGDRAKPAPEKATPPPLSQIRVMDEHTERLFVSRLSKELAACQGTEQLSKLWRETEAQREACRATDFKALFEPHFDRVRVTT